MASPQEAPSNDYDVVVIGAGLGGLSAAATLARAGKHVLLVERGDGPGGYAHAFRRGPYLFDPAIHLTMQGNDGEFLDKYLQVLGVRDRVDFIPLRPAYGVAVGTDRFEAPIGVEEFISAHAQRFPAEAEGIGTFVRIALQVVRESQQLAQRLSLSELDRAAREYPTLFQYRTALLPEVLDPLVRDLRLKAILSALWPYLGVPPSSVTFMQYATFLINWIATGAVYSRGSFQRLADAFVTALQQNGGDLLLNVQATRIHLEGGRVAGVSLANGSTVRASAVVSNADARQTYERMVGLENLPPPFVKRLMRMKPSLSAFVLYLASRGDPRASGIAHEMFVCKSWDHEQTYRDVLGNKPGGMWISIPTLHDPSLAPAGEHVLVFSSLMPYDIGVPWPEAEARYTQMMLDELEAVWPGSRDHMTVVETATPLTLERYTLNQRGAIYGWDHIPSQSTPRRLAPVSPVPGLYLAGHWTDPGCGSFRCMFSGLLSATILLGHKTPFQLFEAIARAAG
jgi:prolycopene isomerase